jgi:hypothetical protein
MLPAMCRGVRPVGQELPAVSLWLPSTWQQHSVKPSRVPVLTSTPDMPVLLQQHQDDDERPVSRLSPAVR